MQQQESTHNISVTWRGKKFIVEMNSGATLKGLGLELQKLTDVKADTMRLIVPQSSNKSSKLLSPFSDEHSALSLQELSFLEGKSIRMMGVPEVEVDEVLQSAKTDLRIAGFEEEEKRLRQRMLDRPHTSLKLPQGTYIFCDFRTLRIPGTELNPPASEALKRMHMLAADPGIVAIMNKHRWRVGIMTEMAPEGYVGVSPKCILGFNKNQGEEISLRLRTDDLKGFRKYESIKKTLLHELAHMVYSEHDANFYALDKQLNQEAASLDWTRSRSHTLSGVRHSEHYEEEFYVDNSSNLSHKLGGRASDQLANARASSVAAAHRRIADASANISTASKVHEEPDPDDSGFDTHEQTDCMDDVGKEKMNIENQNKSHLKFTDETDHDNCCGSQNKFEPNADDDTEGGEAMESEPYSQSIENGISLEPDPDDVEMTQFVPPLTTERKLARAKACEEPDPDDTEIPLKYGKVDSGIQPRKTLDEPDPDDSEAKTNKLGYENIARPDQDDFLLNDTVDIESKGYKEPDPDDSQANGVAQAEPDPDDNLVPEQVSSRTQTDEPDPDDQELQRIQDPVTIVCSRLQKAIEVLRSEVNPLEAALNDTVDIQSKGYKEPDPDDSQANGVAQAEPDPDDNLVPEQVSSRMQTDEPDPDDQELQRIQDPVTIVCSRLQKAIEVLRSEVNPLEAASVLQTLFKIIRNVIENPDEMKFKRLRKANPTFQRNVANYKAAMEILFVIGFNEDDVLDEIGKAETYLVLKRNDPGLLWLAKSSLETCIAY